MELKYVGFFNYKKRIKGNVLPITKMICYEDSLEEAVENVKQSSKMFNKSLTEFHISEYDENVIKLREFRLS